MTDLPELETDPDAVADRRNEVAAAVREHASGLARALARVQGGDYGRRAFTTGAGEWTLKYEAGDVEFLLFEPRSGDPVYVVSTKQPPEPDALAMAAADYDAFVRAFDRWVDSLAGALDDAPTEFPDPADTSDVVAERERVLARIREVCTEMVGELDRYEGDDYGTFTARVDGSRWELKRDGARVSYLRVGGSDGVYLLSQYGPPSVPDLRELAPDVDAFVATYNEHVAELTDAAEELEV
ncbi:MAG: hypothetical protein ABEJ05_10325 [Haloglomus sp.]